jgi:UPF0042 nucleotide-binding protein
MATRMVSFGFKYGTPMDADLVLDVRFLDNPYFVPELKHLPGTDPKVVTYVLSLPETKELLVKTRELLAFVMPKYEREGKSYLTIAIGCTGGRHRSVVLADVLAKSLEPVSGQPITVVHRDVLRHEEARAPVESRTDPSESATPPERASVSMIERVGVAQRVPQTAYGPADKRGPR